MRTKIHPSKLDRDDFISEFRSEFIQYFQNKLKGLEPDIAALRITDLMGCSDVPILKYLRCAEDKKVTFEDIGLRLDDVIDPAHDTKPKMSFFDAYNRVSQHEEDQISYQEAYERLLETELVLKADLPYGEYFTWRCADPFSIFYVDSRRNKVKNDTAKASLHKFYDTPLVYEIHQQVRNWSDRYQNAEANNTPHPRPNTWQEIKYGELAEIEWDILRERV